MKNIEKLQKNVEKLGEVAELYAALGSDADKDPEAFVDNDGNPMKVKQKKSKMCEHIYQKKFYEDEDIKMKTKDAYHIKTVLEKTKVMDAKTKQETCYLCPKGHNCPHAHNPIELDLIPLKTNLKQL